MFNETHDLAQDFPEHKELIHDLKMNDAHFQKLLRDYENSRKELHRIQQELETPGDLYTEILKKKILHLKDELHAMLHKAG